MPQMGPIAWVSLLLAISFLMLVFFFLVHFMKDQNLFAKMNLTSSTSLKWSW